MLLLLLMVLAPIATYYTIKNFGSQSKFKKFLMWVMGTWLVELGLLTAFIVT